MNEMIRVIQGSWREYFGNGLYAVLWIVAIMYLLFGMEGKEEALRNRGKEMVFQTLCILFLINNPITGYVICAAIGKIVYWRCYWVPPILISIAFAATVFVHDISEQTRRILVTIAFSFIIMLSGRFLFTAENFPKADNIEKIPQGVMEVDHIIWENEKLLGRENEKVKAVVETDIAPYIRQYDADIVTLYGRRGKTSGDKKFAKKIRKCIRRDKISKKRIRRLQEEGYEYIVLYKHKVMGEKFIKYGYEVIEETALHKVYFWKGE